MCKVVVRQDPAGLFEHALKVVPVVLQAPL